MSLYDIGKKAINELNQKDFEAYLVGGCVRDMLLQTPPKDIDIATNATTDQMKEVFANFRVIETGVEHGTLTVMVDKTPVEITTYRIDGEYKDYRHPETVTFTKDIYEDLSRRDFTIGAIAFDGKKEFIDPFGGKKDLQNKLIKAVGDPEARFREDPLRILRALRFSAVLGFTVEKNTKEAIFSLKELLKKISAERIQVELSKMLLSGNFYQIFMEYKEVFFVVMQKLEGVFLQCADKFEKKLQAMKYTPENLPMRLALLLSLLELPQVKQELKQLRYANDIVNRVAVLAEYENIQLENNKIAIKFLLQKFGDVVLLEIVTLQKATLKTEREKNKAQINYLNEIENAIHFIVEEKECYSLTQLKINGADLIALGFAQSPQLGKVLNALLCAVIEEKLENNKEALLKRAQEILNREI